MYIKDIILDGFKIYENKTYIRNLNKSYNAITGLNGSGKSNIIDGIIFALGLESKKILRTNTLKELINVQRKDCKVTLILSNTDKTKSPEGYKDLNEIIISRFIDSTGKNKFLINNHSCSLATIRKLCLSMNLNSEKGEFFFIIMQGHITKILNMKSKEIGNLIEETAGTRSYIKEKEKGVFAIEKKETKLIEVRDTLQRLISPFYLRLRKEREAYIEQKNLDNIKKDIQIEQKQIQNMLLIDDISKNILNLKSIIESYILDANQLKILELKLAELQDIESEDNILLIKDILEDEKSKLDDLKKTDLTMKIKSLKYELENTEITNKKFNLEELKIRENFLIRNLKNENGLRNKDFEIIEELGNLKIKKTELEYQLGCMNEFNIDEINNKLANLDKYRVNYKDITNDKNRLNYLKMKLIYPIKDDIYGTIDENFTLIDEKYREAVFKIMGGKSKYVIVSDEKIGSELLNSSDRRISIIPLNKIKTMFVDKNVIKKVRDFNGFHIIDLIKFDNKIRKAMEYIFNGIFVFEDKEKAKKLCFDLKIICVTLDGNIYDPKGTLTGGKSNFKIEIISSIEIQELQSKIERAEKKIAYFNKNIEEYESLKVKRDKCSGKEKLIEKLNEINLKIKTIVDFETSTANVREEISAVRKNILEAIKEEGLYKDSCIKRDNLIKKISMFEETVLENNLKQKECIDKILKLEDKLGELEIKNSNKRLSERQIDGLEPKQKYLIRSISKLKNRIKKAYSELEEMIKKLEDKDFLMVPDNEQAIFITWTERYTEGKNQEIFDSLGIDKQILNFNLSEIDQAKHKNMLVRLSELNISLEKCNAKNTIRMDPSNFDLLEKNEMIIQSLKDKIKQLEDDKKTILSSITSFDMLGLEENEKAFRHLNNKVGIFLRYFLKDSDVKIEKVKNSNKVDEYELKVKIGNWKDYLSELSGGQRSLVALCLIFSILTYRPAPFYIFDEIDSALDLSYTQSIGEIIKREFNKSQFIVISLKNGMYESADSVFKVFLKDGKSNICQIK